jgi:hypothetical protein
VWRVPVAGGTPELFVDGGYAAWESLDGTELFYGRGGAIYARPLPGGPERQVVPSVVNNREFFPTKSGIFYAVKPDAAQRFTYEIRFSPSRRARARRCTASTRSALARA